MKEKRKIILILLLGILILGCFSTSQVKATEGINEEVTIEILDTDGYGEQVYGWNGRGQLIEKNSLEERNFIFTTNNNYGSEFETDIGKFVLEENSEGKYVYTCLFNKEYFADIRGEYELVFIVNNQETGNIDTLKSYFYLYDEKAILNVIDSEENNINYLPPNSGGIGTILNQDLDLANCKYEIILRNDYGEKFETELGTFTFKEQKEDNLYDPMGEKYTIYKYTCPVNMEYIKNIEEGPKNYFSDVENKSTDEIDKVLLWIWFYRLDLVETSNLSVNGIDMIKDGEVIKDIIGLDEGEEGDQIEYQEHTNKIVIKSGDEINLNYSDMGEDFNIEWNNFSDKVIKVNITSQDTKTGITMDNTIEGVNGTTYTAPKLNVNSITSGEIYNRVQTALNNKVNKFVVYDIKITSENVIVQPNGKVEIKIPIPSDFDSSNLVVYRIDDDGTENKYEVEVETINNNKYAVFETDHFSTYVLAESNEQLQSNNEIVDNTIVPYAQLPQTGVTIVVILLIGISLISIIVSAILTKKTKIK